MGRGSGLLLALARDMARAQRLAAQAERRRLQDTARQQRIQKQYERAVGGRNQAIEKARAAHEATEQQRLAQLRQQNAELDELARAYSAGERRAIIAYCTMVLERSEYPEGFPQGFRYVKARDSIEEKPRKTSEIKELYQDVVAAVAIRTLHEVFEADQGNHLAIAVFNGFVSTRDAATGQPVRPCLISVRSTKQTFAGLDLAHIDKRACLRNLGAHVSPQPAELQPVKPLIEFDMVDRRFVEGSDLLVDLESRPNLMDLTPFEFENLVGNLFSKMGLETEQTRSSRDGGVDVVAFDTRPIIGGKVVIQAKRYKNTVGVAAVRDLFGTMTHEGANKGHPGHHEQLRPGRLRFHQEQAHRAHRRRRVTLLPGKARWRQGTDCVPAGRLQHRMKTPPCQVVAALAGSKVAAEKTEAATHVGS
jgi:restriction system protein